MSILMRVIGVFTLTPYDYWRRTHAIHRATSGNLDRRGIGDVDTLAVGKYRAHSRWGRLKYRLYRHPMVMFSIGPAYLFFLQHRLPVGLISDGWQPWLSTMATNAAIGLIVAGLIVLVGVKAFIVVCLPALLLAASMDVWLFYVQHQFEEMTWRDGESWSLHEAALHGSSHYDLPTGLRWITANIGIHHVHHLAVVFPIIQSYRWHCSRPPWSVHSHPFLSPSPRYLLQHCRLACTVRWREFPGGG